MSYTGGHSDTSTVLRYRGTPFEFERHGVYWLPPRHRTDHDLGVDMTETSFLAALHAGTQHDAQDELLACCASPRWAAEVAARRPYHDLATITAVSDAALAALDWPEVALALAAHPRIGERAGVTATDREAAWSRGEQSAAAADLADDADTARRLVDGNVEYERRFGHVFLICASGRNAAEILAALRERLGNDQAIERLVVREELRRIVALRLAKLVNGS